MPKMHCWHRRGSRSSLAAALHLQASQISTAPLEITAGIDDGLPEASYAAALDSLYVSLKSVDTSDVTADRSLWPDVLREPLDKFLAGYGRWADLPLETARPRWVDDPAALLAALPELTRSGASVDPLEDNRRRSAAAAGVSRQLKGGQRKQFDSAVTQVEQLAALLPRVHDAVVIVAAAARYWVSGAANEALADGRLQSADEVFLLELEELKQMMTGEWSNVAHVRPLVEARQAELA